MKILADLAEWNVEFLDEDFSPEDSFEMPDDIELVYKQLREGNRAAWFLASLEGKIKGTGIVASDSLGGCSYRSFNEFLESAEYKDMQQNVLNELEKQVWDNKEHIRNLYEFLQGR